MAAVNTLYTQKFRSARGPPKVSVFVADQKDRGPWGRDWLLVRCFLAFLWLTFLLWVTAFNKLRVHVRQTAGQT